MYSRGLPQLDQPVAFTGCDPIERAQLEGRAIAARLRVKARRARDLGTRIVSPDVSAYMVAHIQPALAVISGSTQQPVSDSNAATATAH